LSTLLGVRSASGTGVIVDVVSFVRHGQSFVAYEAPTVVSTTDIVTAFGAYGFDTTVRALFEGPVIVIFLVALTDSTEEHFGLEDEDLALSVGTLFLHTDHLNVLKLPRLAKDIAHTLRTSRTVSIHMVFVQTGEIIGVSLMDTNLQSVLQRSDHRFVFVMEIVRICLANVKSLLIYLGLSPRFLKERPIALLQEPLHIENG
jgi:hypothetical protein